MSQVSSRPIAGLLQNDPGVQDLVLTLGLIVIDTVAENEIEQLKVRFHGKSD